MKMNINFFLSTVVSLACDELLPYTVLLANSATIPFSLALVSGISPTKPNFYANGAGQQQIAAKIARKILIKKFPPELSLVLTARTGVYARPEHEN
jgi:hypothetical protein